MTLEQVRAKAIKIDELVPTARKVIDDYLTMELFGTTTHCAYHINVGSFSRKRVLLGKGTPTEIRATALQILERRRLIPETGDSEQLLNYFHSIGLGVDCSGFASWVLNAVTEEKLGQPLWKCLKFTGTRRKLVSRFRPVENISANFLTNQININKIDDLQNIKAGDLIRADNGNHVIVITEVGYKSAKNIAYFTYAHSSCSYGNASGARTGFVIVTKPKGYLCDQHWIDDYHGVVPALQSVIAGGEDSVICRLTVLT